MMELDELQRDCARRQRKGLHFILASVVIWGLILATHLTGLDIGTKNLITFCCSAVLFPLAWGISKALKIVFEGKGNPLTKAGILFSAHLMPFSWLYQSRSYLVLSIVIPVLSLVLGLSCPPFVLAAVMVFVEAVFSFLLFRETR